MIGYDRTKKNLQDKINQLINDIDYYERNILLLREQESKKKRLNFMVEGKQKSVYVLEVLNRLDECSLVELPLMVKRERLECVNRLDYFQKDLDEVNNTLTVS